MSAWSKQAIPLVFLEIVMNAVLVGNNEHAVVRRIDKRVQRWLSDCWGIINSDPRGPAPAKAERKVQAASAELRADLERMWPQGIPTPSEVTVAMCIIVSDTRDSMPKKHPARRPWGYLLKALDDLFYLTDPNVTDDLGYQRGKTIAAHVLRVAA